MKKINSSFSLIVLSTVLALSACGGGGGGGGSTAVPSTSVGVTPALGAFSSGAVVEAFKTDGTFLATGTTNSDGLITGLNIPTSHTDAIILRVKGAANVAYFDEGQNAQVALGASDTVFSVLPAGALVANGKFGITPLTGLAAGLAGVVDTSGVNPSIPGSLTAGNTAVSAALKKVQALTGLVDFDLTMAPNPLKDLTATRDASSKSDLYGVMLAELAKAAGKDGALAQAKQMLQAGQNAKAATDDEDFDAELGTSLLAVSIATNQLETNGLLTNKDSSGAGDFKKFINASSVAVKPKDLFSTSDLAQLITSRSSELSTQVTLRAAMPLSNLQGIWDTAAGAAIPASALITPDGRLMLRMQPSSSSDRIVVAQIKPTSAGYAASGLDILMQDDQTTPSEATLTISGVTAASALTLKISKKGQEDQTLSLSYSNRYETAVTLLDYLGTWSDVVGDYAQVVWTINSKGEISGTSSSSKQCVWAGKVALLNEAKGVAKVTVKETCGSNSIVLSGLVTFKAGSNKSIARVTVVNSSGTKALLLELVKS
jgi:hypothetical protein